MLTKIKKSCEKFWMTETPQQGKSKLELERDKQYETKWGSSQTILAVELLVVIILLLLIAVAITVK